MKKTREVTKRIIYNLSEEDKKAIKRVYVLLEEIDTEMDEDDIIEINEDETWWFKYDEIKTLYDGLDEFLKADYLILTTECKTETEVIK